jgi:hypothetical protein
MQAPYERLSVTCLWKWFTTSIELKPNYMYVMEVGTTLKSNKKNYTCIGGIPKNLWFHCCS